MGRGPLHVAGETGRGFEAGGFLGCTWELGPYSAPSSWPCSESLPPGT